MNLSERKLKILQAIIGDFIHSAEPVGSRTLSKKYDMGISPATIRNEMSDLEEMGFLTHPHTSAGRIPSDKAYRLYVNMLMEECDLPQNEKTIIEDKIKDNMFELEKTIEKAVSLVSELTNLTSFATTPRTDEDKLKYINILPVDENTVVLMIVAESGKVSNTVLHTKVDYTLESLELLSKNMTYNYKGKSISNILTLDIIKNFQTDIEALAKIASDIIPNFLSTLENMLNVNLFTEGLANIFSIPEYCDIGKAENFIKIMQEKEKFRDVLSSRGDGFLITIGGENGEETLKDCSLITCDYRVNGEFVGKLGVIGPTRMEYAHVTSVIRYVTDNISEVFKIEE